MLNDMLFPVSIQSRAAIGPPAKRHLSGDSLADQWWPALTFSMIWGSIWIIGYKLIEPWHEISNNVVWATSNASDQPAHMRSLIRAFASRLNILWVLSKWLNIVMEFLSLKGGCTSSSESTLVKIPHCWKSHCLYHRQWTDCWRQTQPI